MTRGNVDIFASRRANFEECEYWLRDINSNPNELLYQLGASSGSFDAKQISAETNGIQVIGGIFMVDVNGVSIQTDDDIRDLKTNDFVKYKGEFYRVTDIQKAMIRTNNQFTSEISYRYYINLRG